MTCFAMTKPRPTRAQNLSGLLSPKRALGRNSFIEDEGLFRKGVNLITESIDRSTKISHTVFSSDYMVVWNRNLGFLRDPFFRGLFDDPKTSAKHRAIVWRTYLLEYFAQAATDLPGDFLEVGCYTGYSASVLTQRIDFQALDKRYLLFDMFEWRDGDSHLPLKNLSDPDLYESVRQQFADTPAVSIIKGRVPDSFTGTLPDRIAFAHIDLNNAEAEAAAVEQIYPRLSPGAYVIFDDYGWWTLSDQKIAVDGVLERHGARAVELPTGQGLLIKRA